MDEYEVINYPKGIIKQSNKNSQIEFKTSKYKNKKVVVDNIKFDSEKEAKRYKELKILEKVNIIKNLRLQPKFPLLPNFEKNGKKYRSINYIADFMYYDNKLNKTIVEDVKGMKTEVYKLKKKIFEYKYKELEIKEV